jgi:uncharacterized spore protein YtfJ
MEHVKDILGHVTSELTRVAQSNVVVGDTVELGGVKIVPLSRISLGFGGGGGEGEGDIEMKPGLKAKKSKSNKSSAIGSGIGGGAGGGAKVRPVGVAVFSDDGVEVLSIADEQGLFDKIFDKVPDIIEVAKSK